MTSKPPAEVDPLLYYKQKLVEAEYDLQGYAMMIETDAAARALIGNPGWKRLQERLRDLIRSVTEKLITEKTGFEEMCRKQGYIRGLRCVAHNDPLSEEDLAELKQKCDDLAVKIAELRHLTN